MTDEIIFDGKLYVSAHDAARIVGVTGDYIARLAKSGQILPVGSTATSTPQKIPRPPSPNLMMRGQVLWCPKGMATHARSCR